MFLITLPDHIPMPHLSTMTRFFDEDEPALGGKQLFAFEDAAEPLNVQGQVFVSLRFWQVRTKPNLALLEDLNRALEVGSTMWPNLLRSPKDKDSSIERWFSDQENYRTIVEAVTVVRSQDEILAPPGPTDPFTRCIDVISEHVRAYRISTNARILDLTYERVPIIIPCFWRSIDGTAEDTQGPTLMLLDHSNIDTIEGPDILGDEEQSNTRVTYSRLLAGDPFMLYVERRTSAQVEFWNYGQYGECCVQSSIAAEILFDGVLSMVLWEDCRSGTNTIEGVAEIFSSDIVPRLKNQFHGRLGGTWSLRTGHLKRWDRDIATVRNRVVHAGYHPTRDEASSALESLLDLERFIQRRLVDRFTRYPLTSVLFVGQPGFERVNRWRSVQRWLEESQIDWVASINEYSEWRSDVNERVIRRRRTT